MGQEFFEGVRQWVFTHQGMTAKMPVFYYDTTSITAIYTAATRQVKKRLPLRRMHPVELRPGRCLVAFSAFEYRSCDIEPYNEVSIAFPITFGRPQLPWLSAAWQAARRRINAYVWQLPVSTESARASGVALYGYPKFLADIEFEKAERRITCHLTGDGEPILALTGKVLSTRPQKRSRIRTYSVLEGTPLLANMVFNPLAMAHSNDKHAALVQTGSRHPICKALRALELSEYPIHYQYSPVNQSILFPARNLLDR